MISATERLNAEYWFGGLLRGSKLSTAIFAAVVIAFVVWYVMQKTTPGYEMKLTGQNPRFARFSGLRIDRKIILCMTISGAMCGLVGMFRVYGAEHLFKPAVSNDYYFEGLMVAMIARYQPLATILLSLFFAVLKIGAEGLQQVGVPNQIYLIIQTVIIFFMAAQGGFLEALTHSRNLKSIQDSKKGGA
jgi:simple sugar transport system permease protein